jgi:hypothetical protein
MSVPLDPETEKTVDSIIDRLLSVRGNKPGKATQVGPQSYQYRVFLVSRYDAVCDLESCDLNFKREKPSWRLLILALSSG